MRKRIDKYVNKKTERRLKIKRKRNKKYIYNVV
jgi:hypothetical protein